jgi:ubiquinone/menaquinone biosynthesis C-methylase UbiE
MSPVFKDQNKQKNYIKDYFDEYSKEYHKDHYIKKGHQVLYPVLAVRMRYMAEMLSDFKKNGKIIDIGCGTGEMLQVLEEKKFNPFGMDYSFEMLREIFKETGGEKYPLINGDIENLSFKNGSFDGIICAGVIEYLNEDKKALHEISRVLKPGGFAVISLSNRLSPARIFEPFVHNLIGQKIKGFIKKNILRKKSLLYPPFRTHIPGSFNNKAKSEGLILREFNYYHFQPIPWPFNRVFHRFNISRGLKMERLSRTKIGFLGRGYIAKYQKLVPF